MFDWITALLENSGYLGVAALMFLENVFPPIPSEVVMPMAGFLVQQGRLNALGVVLAGSLGSLAGAYAWYWAAMRIGNRRLRRFIRRYGRWLTLSESDLDKTISWFARHQNRAVFFGRMVPAVRTLVSVPAGFARMNIGAFLLFTLAGTVIWVAVLSGGGYLLGQQYELVADWLNPLSNLVIGVIIAIYIYRVATGKAKCD
uniref:DedA family protein n=1 Tax=Pararhizobium sp. IMCC3301 TaxID=3067904 RepID=UPI0027403C61|nr:DedA family protein [Pararhizobium sp. IMCC3301]